MDFSSHVTSVVNGAVSAILGVLMLAFANYNVFRTYYFKMYFSIVIFGAAYGLIFLPVVSFYHGHLLNDERYYH